MRGFLLALTAAAVVVSLLQSLLPKGTARRIAVFAGGLVMILAVMSPLMDLNEHTLTRIISDVLVEHEAMETGIRTENREVLSSIIKDRTEAYILDKAEESGLSLQVEVELDESDYPCPIGVKLKGEYTDDQRKHLTAVIEHDLGISEDSQQWDGT